MKIRKIIVMLIVFAVTLVSTSFLYQTDSYAAAKYDTTSYNVNVDVNKNDSYDVTETIAVDFADEQHGLYRYIPTSSNYTITDISVDDYDYENYKEDSNEVIKIGSADFTVTGPKTYTLHYTINQYAENNTSMDQFYLDVLPSNWETSIDSAEININLPDDFAWNSIACYSSEYGGTGNDYAVMNASEEDHKITITGSDIPKDVGITIKATMDDGYWVDALSHNWVINLNIGIIIAAILLLLFIRMKFGKNPEITPVVEFYPPEGITPAEAGYVADGVMDARDFSSTFFYLAEKGYIEIHEYAKKKYEFKKIKEPTEEKQATVDFFNAIFGNSIDGTYIKLKDINDKLGEAMPDVKDDLDDEYSGVNRIFTKASKTADTVGKAIVFLVLGLTVFLGLYYINSTNTIYIPVIAAVIGYLVINKIVDKYYHRYSTNNTKRRFSYILLFIVYAVIILLCAFFTIETYDNNIWVAVLLAAFGVTSILTLCGMRSRTKENALFLGRLIGFRNFIRDAELDKLNELVETDPEYFYNILPYAYVFDLSSKWAKNFETINVDQPDWYTSYLGGSLVFNIMIMNSMTNSIGHGIEQSIRASSDQGGGGFGGGFSGGGSGGGGGGAW